MVSDSYAKWNGRIENVWSGKKSRPALSSIGQKETEERFTLSGPKG